MLVWTIYYQEVMIVKYILKQKYNNYFLKNSLISSSKASAIKPK